MRRLLQGDVGSGKTIVSFQAAIIAIENGYQVALMAPTEILAQQHYFSARRILENAGYRIVLLTGSLEADRKREIRRHIAQGNAQLVIGTHALLEEKVEFAKPGLVIVDEQHRFGVLQRLKLMKKSEVAPPSPAAVVAASRRHLPAQDALAIAGGTPALRESAEPDVLVMTATPIPARWRLRCTAISISACSTNFPRAVPRLSPEELPTTALPRFGTLCASRRRRDIRCMSSIPSSRKVKKRN